MSMKIRMETYDLFIIMNAVLLYMRLRERVSSSSRMRV
jgi:hypothetical protein